MRTGRPKSFDEEAVLDRAMELFWLRGYEGVGLAELLARMGISRQSLYDTFGSKRGLFIRAVEHYRRTQLGEALALLEREGSRVENVKAVMGYFERLAGHESHRGCLVANALVELGPHDPEVATLLRDTLELLRSGLERALREAQERGEMPGDRAPAQLSRALVNAMLGLAVTGRLGLGPAVLRDVYEGTLSMLERPGTGAARASSAG